uniref:Cytochrome c oxidase subunit 2 n=1 Tax=Tachaea chinensis TaxID=1862870 RepID=A0A7L4XRA7_9CRUS|nr:cytochrome c oxidase subunit II [Tachaea chinensis]ATO58508.1 cytochrome c oxidase subunit 2 [Tachaea chinensis]QGT15727.1 cytochrome c oxidase subunit 2 [Tachaea chinensis]
MMWWNSLNLQNSSSPLMEQLTSFHDHTMMMMIMILSLTGYMMAIILTNNMINRNLLFNHTIEIIWTILPALILVFIALPSLRTLYLMDEIHSPSITIKSIGHQWYWSYEYSDFSDINFDSYMIPTNELEDSMFRLLETDNHVVLPMLHMIRVLTTSSDVIHSWTIPSLGVKSDSVPGRLNQMSFSISKPGLLYGQCSEICGSNHSFMPITLESVNMKSFLSWLKT